MATSELAHAVFERARNGDHDAFRELVRHYDVGLRALAFRLLGDPARMDDALQEAYVNAFRALPSFRGHARLGTWLYRITYNACLDELERSRRVVRLPLDDVEDTPTSGQGTDDAIELRGALRAALAALSVEDRATVLLVDAHEFTYEEAAEILGIPSGTVGSRLNRARASLRGALAPETKGAARR